MGKTRKNNKNEIRTQMPLDEQITSSRVVKSKNKNKLRLRAEEEGVCNIELMIEFGIK